ncbi:hypothetical protein CANTEDRAFT_115956 [Yamadazyma tenuis ATCC 10573]|uniref:Major facilitator superfamily (MFS) profile domain-containing protein n=2 Tax=Candida tenuis (strain ATCC 10573 / BCRC 21748 / CBS 615 / JCM 9827 / NBRC 10315 / NRRL Y-1498 / VKM Y-70) TaxID=590646 RepID=G3BEL7_CANTC|nr:uncharacterized protein CANTEDRAFT_115956 [Yamadazyma tenuis ATCC 10573]EGV59924.1 hypothetical protein CANTEDRAFT_115956 [Yamadazyma tenuis ATCC 10573]
MLERRICRKFDIHILPVIAVMYLFNSLDKGNISNAKTNGMDIDIGMSGNEWNNMLSIFYVPFVMASFPLIYLMKKYTVANVIPFMMFGFGLVTLLEATVFNYGTFLTCRWFLGMFESAFFPGIIYYLTTFYRRDEMGRRLSIFYAAMSFSNAFSGLLAYGVFQIKTGSLKGWQYLFLIEGALTVIMSVISFFYLPRSVEKCSFLTEEERKCAIWRIETDSSSSSQTETSIKEAVEIFKHPFTYFWLLLEVCIGVPLYSITNWFPEIIQRMGEGTVMTNLYTVAPNAWGAISLLILGFCSDFAKVRSAFIMLSILVTLVGFVTFYTLDPATQKGAAYFCCFLMTSGSSASSVLTSIWYNNNIPNQNHRALMTVTGSAFGNAAGLISTNIFFPREAPKYESAMIITACFGAVGICTVGVILVSMIIMNRKRNKESGEKLTYRDIPTYELKESFFSKTFRWMY